MCVAHQYRAWWTRVEYPLILASGGLKIRVGYPISLSGPLTGSTLLNYRVRTRTQLKKKTPTGSGPKPEPGKKILQGSDPVRTRYVIGFGFGSRPGIIPGPYQVRTGSVPGPYRVRTGSVPGSYRGRTGSIPGLGSGSPC